MEVGASRMTVNTCVCVCVCCVFPAAAPLCVVCVFVGGLGPSCRADLSERGAFLCECACARVCVCVYIRVYVLKK